MIQRSTGPKSQDSPETQVDEASVPTFLINDGSPLTSKGNLTYAPFRCGKIRVELTCGKIQMW